MFTFVLMHRTRCRLSVLGRQTIVRGVKDTMSSNKMCGDQNDGI